MSKNIKLGNIPKRIKIYCRPEEAFHHRWDDIEVDESVAGTKGFPAFVTDAENPKTIKTAEDWCNYRQYDWVWNPETGNRERVDRPKEWFVDERDNDPLTSVRLIGLEHRGNGGRAYKVKINDKYVFDLREDVLLDILLNVKTENGYLPGEYVFAKVGAEMKLVRVGSLLHTKMVDATDYWKDEVITKFDIGGIYQNKIGKVIYLGQVYRRNLDVAWQKKAYSHWNHHELHDDYEREPTSIGVTNTNRKVHLFYEFKEDDKEITSFDQIKHFIGTYYCQFRDKAPQSYRRKVGQLTDENLLEKVKERIKTEVFGNLNVGELRSGRGRYHIAYEFMSLAPILNASYDDPKFVHPEVAKILT